MLLRNCRLRVTECLSVGPKTFVVYMQPVSVLRQYVGGDGIHHRNYIPFVEVQIEYFLRTYMTIRCTYVYI
jgi:hypothetical protein